VFPYCADNEKLVELCAFREGTCVQDIWKWCEQHGTYCDGDDCDDEEDEDNEFEPWFLDPFFDLFD